MLSWAVFPTASSRTGTIGASACSPMPAPPFAAPRLELAPWASATKSWPLSSRSALKRHLRSRVRKRFLCKENQPDVCPSQFRSCPSDDDYQRGLLGLLGQYLQRRQDVSLRAVLLGLRRRNLFDLRHPGLHHGQHRRRSRQFSE